MNILVNHQIDPLLWNKLCKKKSYIRFEWHQIISSVYGLKPLYILVYEHDQYAMIASFETVKGIVSLPFLSYSGFLFNSQEALEILNRHMKRKNIHIDARNLTALGEEIPHYVTSVVDVKDINLLTKSLSSNTRSKINRAIKHGFTVGITNNRKNIDTIYEIYARKMHELGTPAHKQEFLESIIENIDTTLLITIDYKEKPIGFLFCVYDGDTLYDLFASVLSEYSKLYPNYLLYIETMRIANRMQLKYFDMGRSTYGSTVHQFKQKWKPTDYSITSSVVYRKSGSLGLLSKIWQKLPYCLTLWLGPKVRKYLP